MRAVRLPMLLLPGAWMGGWIWSGTVNRLRGSGCAARTLTLPGLQPRQTSTERASVGLADHVGAAVREVEAIDDRLVLVGHSYSGIVAGMVADQLGDRVARVVVVAGFFPRHGRSLLDDWGDHVEEQAAERGDIERAGMIWAPPPPEGLRADPGLDASQAQWLGHHLVPHPGRTVVEPVTMHRSICDLPVTVIADVGHGDPRSTLPDDLASATLPHWDFRSIPAGHWPMLSSPRHLDAALLDTAA